MTVRRLRSIVLPCCLVVAGAIVGAYLASRLLRQPGAADGSPIQLTVHRKAGALAITWDSASDPVRRASAGLLTIQDGSTTRTISLSQSELSFGSVLYAPQTGAVQFRLNLYYGADHLKDEAVTAPAGSAPRPAGARPAPIVRFHVPRHRSGAAHRASGAAPRSPEPRRQFQEAPRPAPNASRVELGEPPRIATPAPSAPQALGLPGNPTPPLPNPPAANTSAAAISYIAAMPVKKVVPALTPRLRSLIRENVSVEVAVRIDMEGKVIEARPVGATSADQRLLGAEAGKAAKLWRFQPALRNGRAVVSETILKFDFGRGAQ